MRSPDLGTIWRIFLQHDHKDGLNRGKKLRQSNLLGGVLLETPAGVVDGINTVFTLSREPDQSVTPARLVVLNDGTPVVEGNGIASVSGKSFTLSAPPATWLFAVLQVA